MEIYPAEQLQMLTTAILGGFLFGVMFELLAVLRTLLLLHTPPPFMHSRYLAPLPLLHRPLGLSRAKGKGARGVVIFVQDLLFCCAFSAFVILVLYAYNDGIIRLSVPLLALLGLWAFRISLAPLFGRVNAYLAFVLAVLLRYFVEVLMLPVRLLWGLFYCVLWRAAQRAFAWLRRLVLRRTSRALCRAQCAAAKTGFLKTEKGMK